MNEINCIIADDEIALRHYLKEQLADIWPDLIICGEAKNGKEALKLIEKDNPKIAFLDINMPGLSGIEVARKVVGICRIVFITAYDEYAIEAFENGAIDYILKPVSKKRLKKTVKRLKEQINTPHVPDFTYEGLSPACSACEETNPVFKFFVKRGTIYPNNLVVLFQGGGACWDTETCITFKTYKTEVIFKKGVEITVENLKKIEGGLFGEIWGYDLGGVILNDIKNPFYGWSFVFIPYCTGDVHMGANDYNYGTSDDPEVIQHRGAVNFQVVLKWMKENITGINNTSQIFIAGYSGGGYGALFYSCYIEEAYPDSSIYVLADSSVGVITQEFQDIATEVYNFQLPGDYIDAFTGKQFNDITTTEAGKAIALRYPNIRFAEYTAQYDQIQTMFHRLQYPPFPAVTFLFNLAALLKEDLDLVRMNPLTTYKWYQEMVSVS